MAIENEHKEGIFMRLKKVVIHLAAVTVFCLFIIMCFLQVILVGAIGIIPMVVMFLNRAT